MGCLPRPQAAVHRLKRVAGALFASAILITAQPWHRLSTYEGYYSSRQKWYLLTIPGWHCEANHTVCRVCMHMSMVWWPRCDVAASRCQTAQHGAVRESASSQRLGTPEVALSALRCAFAKLEGDGIEYYVRKLEVMLGRTSKANQADVVSWQRLLLVSSAPIVWSVIMPS
jgi:hypothetical protein